MVLAPVFSLKTVSGLARGFGKFMVSGLVISKSAPERTRKATGVQKHACRPGKQFFLIYLSRGFGCGINLGVLILTCFDT